MVVPVSVGVARFLVVLIIGVAAIGFTWSLTIVFASVSAGLVTIGFGLSLCLLGPDCDQRNCLDRDQDQEFVTTDQLITVIDECNAIKPLLRKILYN